ncbi:hypothetical protein N7470_006654 [Penicillium chermesinum]|nr:hypothetical protein N7470_006654 [Penicillium chermesinum]
MASRAFEMNPMGKNSVEVSVLRNNHSRGGSDGIFNGMTSGSTSNSRRMDRKFGTLSILSLSLTLLSSWESIGNNYADGLANGGPAGLVWGMVLSLIGTMAMALSMAEMTSICPLAGAQYHWTAVLAPQRIRTVSTWFQGWITVFGWQASCTSICLLVSSQIQGMALLNHAEYHPKQWHGTLIIWAIVLCAGIINIYGIKILPTLQMIGGIFHIIFFIAITIPIFLLARRSEPQFVFTELMISEGGGKIPGLLGFDGAIHMSEELRQPDIRMPRIIVQSILIDGILAFIFLLVILFCIGNVDEALNPRFIFPSIGLFREATGSVRAATIMQAGISVIGMLSSIGVVTSVSRLTWAFARDGGLPFSAYFAHVSTLWGQDVQENCSPVIGRPLMLLSLINIASEQALNAILALSTSSIYVSYLIPIVMMIIRRLDKTRPPIMFGPWSLGRYGMAVNVFALIFGIFVCVFVPFPTQIPVTARNMNWSGPVFEELCWASEGFVAVAYAYYFA